MDNWKKDEVGKYLELKVRSKSINKWGDRRGEWVTISPLGDQFICKAGKHDSGADTSGYGNTPETAIENFIFRRYYFDGGKEKYMPYVVVEE